MTSLSTRFFGQPKLTKPTFNPGAVEALSLAGTLVFVSGAVTVRVFEVMRSIDFNIQANKSCLNAVSAVPLTLGTMKGTWCGLKVALFMLG